MIRMLIVDDEHHIVNWLYELFTTKDDPEYEVLKAYSGFEAMQLMKDYKSASSGYYHARNVRIRCCTEGACPVAGYLHYFSDRP